MILEGKKYRHFKVLAIAKHSETQEELVVYRSLEDSRKIWVRPLDMFLEEVDRPEIPYNGPRFTKID